MGVKAPGLQPGHLHSETAPDVLAGLPGSLAFAVGMLSRRSNVRSVAEYYPQFADAFAVQVLDGRNILVHRRLLGYSEAALCGLCESRTGTEVCLSQSPHRGRNARGGAGNPACQLKRLVPETAVKAEQAFIRPNGARTGHHHDARQAAYRACKASDSCAGIRVNIRPMSRRLSEKCTMPARRTNQTQRHGSAMQSLRRR